MVIAAIAIYISGRRIKDKDLPRIAVLCAGIFVAQMLNFPVGGGTTGHLIGGALFAIMVGPVIAIVGMTVILLIQALMFGDGGLTAFGLNAVNMAVIAPLMGWGVYTMLKPLLSKGEAGPGKAFTAGDRGRRHPDRPVSAAPDVPQRHLARSARRRLRGRGATAIRRRA